MTAVTVQTQTPTTALHHRTAPQPMAAPARGGRAVRAADSRQGWLAVTAMLGSGLSNQVGAAVGSFAFPVIGAVGVVTVRQYVAALVLLAVARPRLRSFTRIQWGPIVALAVVFAVMNLSLYLAIERIGLALAVTLEFLGPLAVALAATRRRLDAACALVALTGVLVLVRPRPAADYVGMGLALTAGACWASYILLNRVVGRRTTGAEGSAAAAAMSALIFVPVGAAILAHHANDAAASLHAVRFALVAGVLCSAVPYLVDMFTLRRTTAQSFGLFMSVNPVLAAVVGWLALGQHLGLMEAVGIAAIVTANAVSLATSSRRPARTAPAGWRSSGT